jgi:hypothetical protein
MTSHIERRKFLATLGGAAAAWPLAARAQQAAMRTGVVASLNRPGGNVTGVSAMNAELMTKRFGLYIDGRNVV